MNKKKANNEFEIFYNYNSKFPKDILIRKLFSITRLYEKEIRKDKEVKQGAPKLTDKYKELFCMEMKRISISLRTNVVTTCAEEMKENGFLEKLNKSENKLPKQVRNKEDIAKRYKAFLKEYIEGRIFYAVPSKDHTKIRYVKPNSKEFKEKFVIKSQ